MPKKGEHRIMGYSVFKWNGKTWIQIKDAFNIPKKKMKRGSFTYGKKGSYV